MNKQNCYAHCEIQKYLQKQTYVSYNSETKIILFSAAKQSYNRLVYII